MNEIADEIAPAIYSLYTPTLLTSHDCMVSKAVPKSIHLYTCMEWKVIDFAHREITGKVRASFFFCFASLL